MIFRRFFRNLKSGFQGVFRHFGMAFSSSIAVTITLLLIGVFLVLTFNLYTLTEDIESNISLSVLVKYDYDDETNLHRIQNQIKVIEYVESSEYRTKEKEFEYYVNQFSDEEVKEFYDLYHDDNPFHDVFLVNVNNTEKIAFVKDKIMTIEGVESIYDGGSNTYLLIEILEKIKLIGGILVASLCLLAIYLIYNTIKITINARSTEISIMRTVGASNSYIRVPFLIEGIIIGIMGSIFPIAAIGWGYYYLFKETGGFLFGIVSLIKPNPFIYQIGCAMLIIAVAVGYIGSFFSIVKAIRRSR